MASHLVMLDKKEVDIAYLDRKINYLKIFALIEPENPRFPLEIGMVFIDKGLSLSSLHLVTVSLYRAEEFLRKAFSLNSEDVTVRQQLGEVSYLLGKYDDAVSYWRSVLPQLAADKAEKTGRRVARIAEGALPKVPAVDYLQAVGGAFALHQQGEFEDASAILLDVMDDAVFREEFPLPEVSYILGLCCRHLGMPRHAEDYFSAALEADPANEEILKELKELQRAYVRIQ